MPKSKDPTKWTLARLLKLHDLLRNAYHGKRPIVGEERIRTTQPGLAKLLGVSTKTIQRDLDYLKDTLKLKIARDADGYAYESEYAHLPMGEDVDFDERLALAVARQAFNNYVGVNLAKKLQSAFDKITGGRLDASSALVPESFGQLISVRTPGAGKIDDPSVFHAVWQSLLNRNELQIEYKAKEQAQHKRRHLHPYHLACIENRWILVALDADKKEVRTFVLSRFRNPLVTAKDFQRPRDFDAGEHLDTSFGSWTGAGGALRVKIELNKDAAHHVLEREWHKSQLVTTQPLGHVVVEFKLGDLHDFKRWVLSFGGDCKVLEPASLRQELAEEGRRMTEANS